MDVKEFYELALAQATKVVNKTEEDDYDNPTPDTEWNVRDLLNHMLYELGWSADLLRGRTIAEVGEKYDGDLTAKGAKEAWKEFAETAGDALDDVELNTTVHVSYGDISAEDYLWQNGSDLAIHAWDLGEGIGQEVTFDEVLAQALYDYAASHLDMMRSSGLFGEEIKVDGDADLQTKLLALYGRQK